MKDKLIRRLTYIFSAVGVLPMFLVFALFKANDDEFDFRSEAVVVELLYLFGVPAFIAAVTVIFDRDRQSAVRGVFLFAAASVCTAVMIAGIGCLIG